MPSFTADQQSQAGQITGAGMPSLEANAVVTAITALAVATSGSYAGTNTFGGIVVTGTGTVADLRAASGGFSGNQVNGGNLTLGSGGTLAVSSGRLGISQSAVISANVNPVQAFSATGQGADLKQWQWYGNGADFLLATVKDDFSNVTNAYQVTRGSTFNVASHTWYTSTSAGTALTGALLNGTGFTSVNGFINGTIAISSASTDGFLWIPSGIGAPTGTPNLPYTNAAALYYDVQGTKLYVRSGTAGWARFGTS